MEHILARIADELKLDRHCKECGQLYTQTHPARFYCTTRCSRRAAHRRKIERDKIQETARREGRIAQTLSTSAHPDDRSYPTPEEISPPPPTHTPNGRGYTPTPMLDKPFTICEDAVEEWSRKQRELAQKEQSK